MGKSTSTKAPVDRFLLSVHLGICIGPVDAVSRILMDLKTAWQGGLTETGTVDIYKPQLFGGARKEGGAMGRVHYLAGESDQVMPEHLAARLGRTSATCPAFRNLSSLFFTGDSDGPKLAGLSEKESLKWTRYPGFTWRHNTPYLPALAVTVQRIFKGWSGSNLPGGGEEDPENPDGTWHPSAAAIPRLAVARTENVDVDAAENTGRNTNQGFAHGVTITGFDPTRMLRVTLRDAGPFTAWAKTTPAVANWQNRLIVARNGDRNDLVTLGDNLNYISAAAANDAFGEFWLSGGADYTFFIVDDPSGDNQGGLSIYVEEHADFDMNPAHIILQSLTDGDWGMGAPFSSINEDSFEDAADTLALERLGLSIAWFAAARIEEFIGEILKHISATLFVSPRTGLWTLKLIRDDYDPDTLPVLTDGTGTLVEFSRRAFGETVNEIVVTWTNPENEQEETVLRQDLANISIQGGIVSDTRSFTGVRRRDLAQELAERELRVASAPSASAQYHADRRAWDYVPGGVVKLQSDEHNIAPTVMRIMQVDYGKPGDSTVKLVLVEDVFAQPVSEINEPPPDSEHEVPGDNPRIIEDALVMTLPWFLGRRNPAAADADYPEVIAGVLASQDGTGTSGYELVGEVTNPAGGPEPESVGIRDLVARADLPVSWPREAVTVLDLADLTLTQGQAPVAGGFVAIGAVAAPDYAETLCEWGLVSDITDTMATILRGVLDTVPRPWPVGTPLRFFTVDTSLSDDNVRSDGEAVTYNLLTITTRGQLSLSMAPDLTGTLTGRPHLPLRPANVTVAAVAFDIVDAAGIDPLPVAWSTRNRLTEDSQVLNWTDGPVAAELGQTTEIDIVDPGDGTIVEAFTGLIVSSFDLDADGSGSAFDNLPIAYVDVWSRRDGLRSLQAHRTPVAFVDVLLTQDDFLLLQDGSPVLLN